MTQKQIGQVLEQLPEGTKFLRAYRAFEGDVRVIVQTPTSPFEQRFSIEFIEDYPYIRDCPPRR